MRYLGDVTWERVWDVLKWVLAALAAGFIGQFGRSLALRLIHRRRQAKAQEMEEAASSTPQEATNLDLERDRLETLAKIEKKRSKAEVKRLKKASKTQDDE